MPQKCRNQSVTFLNSFDRSFAAASAEAAARPWLYEVERRTVQTRDPKIRKVLVGADQGGFPYMIFTVVHEPDGWIIEKTTACLAEAGSGVECTETLVYEGREYSLEARPYGVVTGVGLPLGQGEIRGCIQGRGLRGHVARIAPVTVFQSPEVPPKDEVVVSQSPGTQVFTTHSE